MDNSKMMQSSENKPRFFYGYTIVGLCFLIMMIAFGMYSNYGIFVKPLLTSFDWTRAMTSAAFSISFLIFGLVGIIQGGLTDKFGPRLVLTICGLSLGLGYILMSQLNSPWQLYLFYGIIGIGMSAVYAPVLSLVARWFVQRRGLMTGIVIAGLGIGEFTAPPIISRLVSIYGWSLSYIFLGITALIVIVVASQFLKRDPGKIGQMPYGDEASISQVAESSTNDYSLQEALRIKQFWLLIGLKICYGYYMFSIIIHIVPHATDLGISLVNAANILTIHGASQVVASFLLGRAGDKIGPRTIYIICFSIAMVSLLMLTQATEIWAFYLFAIFFGIANGGNVVSDAPLVARLFGLKSIGSFIGISSCSFSIGVALGPLLTGYLFDSTGSYMAAFITCAVISAVGIALTSVLKPTKKLKIKI